jgi:hypothetical protein
VRTCPICGASLLARRSDTRYCGSACRAEGWRLTRLLAGKEAGVYRAVYDRLDTYGRRGAGKDRAAARSRSQRP